MPSSCVADMPKEKLLELIDIYAKLWLAMDGVWFQSVEGKYDMGTAEELDQRVWRLFTVNEATRIKEFLALGENSGVEGLRKALQLRLYAHINEDEIVVDDNVLIYRTLDCRVQNARKRKGMEFHTCKPVGIIEYGYFAKTIDSRFECEAVSCFPDITDPRYNCVWKFTLKDGR